MAVTSLRGGALIAATSRHVGDELLGRDRHELEIRGAERPGRKADRGARPERAEVPLDREREHVLAFDPHVERLERAPDREVSATQETGDAVLAIANVAAKDDVEARSIAVARPRDVRKCQRFVRDDPSRAFCADPKVRVSVVRNRVFDADLRHRKRATIGKHDRLCDGPDAKAGPREVDAARSTSPPNSTQNASKSRPRIAL